MINVGKWIGARFAAALLMATIGAPVGAEPIDPHRVYEQTCARCHRVPHAAEFASKMLRLRDDAPVGARSGKAVRTVLNKHFGTNLAPAEIDALIDMFTRQISNGALFQEKCRICHDRAVVLARSRLVIRDGALRGRYSDRDIRAFLAIHGRLTATDADVIAAMLKWQLETAGSGN